MLGNKLENEEFAASEDDMAYTCSDMASVLRHGRMSGRIRGNPIASYDMSTWESTDTGTIGAGMAWQRRGDNEEEEYVEQQPSPQGKEKETIDAEAAEESERESRSGRTIESELVRQKKSTTLLMRQRRRAVPPPLRRYKRTVATYT